MPQIFQVLRCYKCLIFQVHQTKKLNKWECKLCGEKQSHKRHYGLGSGKECRLHVQKLNSLHTNFEQNISTESDEDSENNVEDTKKNLSLLQPNKVSKWDNYLDRTEPNMSERMEEDSDMLIDGKKVVFEIPKKRKNIIDTDHHRIKKRILNSSQYIDRGNKHNFNPEKDGNLSNVKTGNDRIVNKLDDKLVTRKGLKFIPPKMNVNSKWACYNEETKGSNEETINSTCNIVTIDNKKIQNVPNDSPSITTSAIIKSNTTICNINNCSKWAKFTEDDNYSYNKLESSLYKNSEKNQTDTANLIFKNSYDSSIQNLSDKNVSSQIISNNIVKKSTVTSLFDDGDLDVLDI